MTDKPSISIGLYSDIGPKETNDDCYGVLVPDMPLLKTKGIAMAIADGMSTSESGRAASDTCIKTFLTDYYSTHESWSVKTSVSRVLNALNRWLYAQGISQYQSHKGLVSTFSGLIFKGTIAHVFHAGDSRIYQLSSGGFQQLTRDHRTFISGNKQVLSRAFGIDPSLEVDYQTFSIEVGDRLIFTTDGVHDFISDATIRKLTDDHADNLDEAAKQIVQAALSAGSDDNLSCQIVRIETMGQLSPAAHLKRLTHKPFPPELEAGMVLDGYRIERDLHLSARSQVYLAIDTQSNEKVVLKTPSVNFSDDPVYIEQFTREEWVGLQLENPHILRTFRPDREKRFLYIVMEYIEGQTLTQWMHDNPFPSLAQVRQLVKQIIVGLRAFHRKEMLHQDLKPDNIIIDQHGTVKIIDFGSVRVAGLREIHSNESQEKNDERLLGTFDYSAPEYVLGHEPSTRSDLYSLGVITYEILTGKHPYGKGFRHAKDVEKSEFVPPAYYNKNVPQFVSYALNKAVKVATTKRYASLSEFESDLERPASNSQARLSLMERNPLTFWRLLVLILFLLNIFQIYYAIS